MIVRRRAVFAGLAVVPLLLLASACKDDGAPFGMGGGGGGQGAAATHEDGGDGGRGGVATANPMEPSSGSDDSTSSADDASVLTGTWTGHYICNQGPTNMKFQLTGEGSDVTGTFSFSGLSGTDVPSGSHTVRGTVENGKVTLYGGEWIDHPDGYFMVNFTVTTITPTMLRGTIDGSGCTTFQVIKEG